MQPQAAVILGFRRGLVGGEVPAALCRPPSLFTWVASAAAAVLPLARPDCAAIFRADRIQRIGLAVPAAVVPTRVVTSTTGCRTPVAVGLAGIDTAASITVSAAS